MKDYSVYTSRVEECLTEINIDIDKLIKKGKDKSYNKTMINIIINDKCFKFRLKAEIIKAIYFERFSKN